MDETIEIIGYCAHCKNEIMSHEAFVSKNNLVFHYKPCYRQLDNDDSLFEEELFQEETYEPTE